MKRILALALALCMLLSSAALAEDISAYVTESGLPIVTDASKLEQMDILWVAEPMCVLQPEELPWIRMNQEQTGMVFNWQKVPLEGATERMALILTSDELPDIIWNGVTKATLVQYMDQDIFLPCEDLIENYMPNLKKILDEHPQYKGLLTAPDGHIYGFPYIEEMGGLVLTPGPMVIYKPWLDQLGLDMPTTIDEFYEVLVAFKNAGDLNGNGIDDEIPYALSLNSKETFGSCNTFHMLTGCFGQADSARGAQDDHLSPINGVVTYTAIDEAYRETCKFFHKLWSEGLLDPDSFSPETSAGNPLYYDKLKGSEPIIGVCSMWTRSDVISDETLREGYVPLPRLEGPNGKMGFVLNFSEMQNICNTLITVDCPYPELVARWIDNNYEQFNSIQLNYSPIGDDADDDHRYVWGDEEHSFLVQNDTFPAAYSVWPEWRCNLTPLAGSLAILSEVYDMPGGLGGFTPAVYTDDQNVNGKSEWLEEMEAMPQAYLTQEEQNRISQLQPQLENIVNQYTMNWILDGGADEQWDEYVASLKNAGLDEFVSIYQGVYDRYAASIQ